MKRILLVFFFLNVQSFFFVRAEGDDLRRDVEIARSPVAGGGGAYLRPKSSLERRVHSYPDVSGLADPWDKRDSDYSPDSDEVIGRADSSQELLDDSSKKEKLGFLQRHKGKILVGVPIALIISYSAWRIYKTCDEMEDACGDCKDQLEEAMELVEYWQEKALSLLNGSVVKSFGNLYERCTDAFGMCEDAFEACQMADVLPKGLLAGMVNPVGLAPQGAEQPLPGGLQDIPGGFRR